MAFKIEKKITGYEVVTPETEAPTPPPQEPTYIYRDRPLLERDESLTGTTYKIKTPASDHALYITINDVIIDKGLPTQHRRPFEIFINSKNMDSFQWVVALTRLTSAVFRKGGDILFLVEELKSVFDPHGGYWKKGGKFMPSLVADIGEVIEKHLVEIGMIQVESMSAEQLEVLDEKRRQFEEYANMNAEPVSIPDSSDSGSFPVGASLCHKCRVKAVIKMDGCNTCLNCGDSKCG